MINFFSKVFFIGVLKQPFIIFSTVWQYVISMRVKYQWLCKPRLCWQGASKCGRPACHGVNHRRSVARPLRAQCYVVTGSQKVSLAVNIENKSDLEWLTLDLSKQAPLCLYVTVLTAQPHFNPIMSPSGHTMQSHGAGSTNQTHCERNVQPL